MMKRIYKFKKSIIYILSVAMTLSIFSCAPYNKDQLLCEYEAFDAAYYVTTDNERYKYSDFIVDDVSTGAYKKASPSIADFRRGSSMLDYDIPAYVNAKMDYAIKVELINKHEYEIDDMCAAVRDDYFEYKKSYIYFYDINEKKSTLLCEKPVTNIAYDDETPNITFDVEDDDTHKVMASFKNRKIMLSDIIAANSTISGFMKVLLSQGKEKRAYFLDKRIDNDEMYIKVASISEMLEK